MAQVVQHARSSGSTAPSSLAAGQIAFCEGDGALYIGTIAGGVRKIFTPASMIYNNGAINDIVNVATKQTLLTCTVPGNILGTNRALRIECICDYLNDSGGTRTIAIEVSYGGTVMYAETTTAQTQIATLRHPIYFDLILAAANSASAQVLGGEIAMGNAVATTTGRGDLNTVITNATGFTTPIVGTATVDSTIDQTLTISITHATNNASLSFRKLYADVYLAGQGPMGPKGDAGVSGAGLVAVPVNTVSAGTYTLVLTDLGKKVRCTNACTVTIPNGIFADNDVGYVWAAHASGAVTLASDGTSVLNKADTLVTAKQHSMLTWHKISSSPDTFDIWGYTT